MGLLQIDATEFDLSMPVYLETLGFIPCDSNPNKWIQSQFIVDFGLTVTVEGKKAPISSKSVDIYEITIKSKHLESKTQVSKIREMWEWFNIQTRGLLTLDRYAK